MISLNMHDNIREEDLDDLSICITDDYNFYYSEEGEGSYTDKPQDQLFLVDKFGYYTGSDLVRIMTKEGLDKAIEEELDSFEEITKEAIEAEEITQEDIDNETDAFFEWHGELGNYYDNFRAFPITIDDARKIITRTNPDEDCERLSDQELLDYIKL